MGADTAQGDPLLARLRERLREQIRLAAAGESDPQGFRLQVRDRERVNKPSQTPSPLSRTSHPHPAVTPQPTGGGYGLGRAPGNRPPRRAITGLASRIQPDSATNGRQLWPWAGRWPADHHAGTLRAGRAESQPDTATNGRGYGPGPAPASRLRRRAITGLASESQPDPQPRAAVMVLGQALASDCDARPLRAGEPNPARPAATSDSYGLAGRGQPSETPGGYGSGPKTRSYLHTCQDGDGAGPAR